MRQTLGITPGIVVSLLIALTGCAGTGESRTPRADHVVTTQPTVLTDPVVGRTFRPTEATVDGEPWQLLADAETHFLLSGSIEATNGCNTLSGPVDLGGGRLRLPDGLRTTDMACLDTSRQDAWLADLLTASPRWRLDGERLVLDTADTTLVLTDITPPDPELAGTWALRRAAADDGRVYWRSVGTLSFTDQRVVVDTGCGVGVARYTRTGTIIRFDDLEFTGEGCNAGVDSIEDIMADVLNEEARFSLHRDYLEIAHPSGAAIGLGRGVR
jgi:heat shock protein HslJ